MQIVLWIVTALVALVFLAAGLTKLTQPREKMARQMNWVEDFPLSTVRVIGLLEVLGAAAAGLLLTMIGAATVHLRRREPILPALMLGLLSAATLYGALGN